MPWEVEHLSGTVRELHERSAALLSGTVEMARVARVLQPVDRALVLGSTQPATSVDQDACATAGVDIVRRRSGGGAVLVDALCLLWVDLVVPAGDPLWCPDVGRAAWWVGEAWSEALDRAGMAGTEVWKGPMVRNRWSSLVCFAGPGRRRGRKRCWAKGGGYLSAADTPWGPVPVRLRPELGAAAVTGLARPRPRRAFRWHGRACRSRARCRRRAGGGARACPRFCVALATCAGH